MDTIGTNMSKAYNDLIGSIEGTIGSIGDLFTNNAETPIDSQAYQDVTQGLSDLWNDKSFEPYGNLIINDENDIDMVILKYLQKKSNEGAWFLCLRIRTILKW